MRSQGQPSRGDTCSGNVTFPSWKGESFLKSTGGKLSLDLVQEGFRQDDWIRMDSTETSKETLLVIEVRMLHQEVVSTVGHKMWEGQTRRQIQWRESVLVSKRSGAIAWPWGQMTWISKSSHCSGLVPFGEINHVHSRILGTDLFWILCVAHKILRLLLLSGSFLFNHKFSEITSGLCGSLSLSYHWNLKLEVEVLCCVS